LREKKYLRKKKYFLREKKCFLRKKKYFPYMTGIPEMLLYYNFEVQNKLQS